MIRRPRFFSTAEARGKQQRATPPRATGQHDQTSAARNLFGSGRFFHNCCTTGTATATSLPSTGPALRVQMAVDSCADWVGVRAGLAVVEPRPNPLLPTRRSPGSQARYTPAPYSPDARVRHIAHPLHRFLVRTGRCAAQDRPLSTAIPPCAVAQSQSFRLLTVTCHALAAGAVRRQPAQGGKRSGAVPSSRQRRGASWQP